MTKKEKLESLKPLDGSVNHIFYPSNKDNTLILNGKHFEEVPDGDSIYEDLKYVSHDGSLWVEE